MNDRKFAQLENRVIQRVRTAPFTAHDFIDELVGQNPTLTAEQEMELQQYKEAATAAVDFDDVAQAGRIASANL